MLYEIEEVVPLFSFNTLPFAIPVYLKPINWRFRTESNELPACRKVQEPDVKDIQP